MKVVMVFNTGSLLIVLRLSYFILGQDFVFERKENTLKIFLTSCNLEEIIINAIFVTFYKQKN